MAGAPEGNTNAQKYKIWADAIKRAISRRAEGNLNHGLDTLADKFVVSCLAGEQWALKELGDRLDGKPAQAHVGGGAEDAPITHLHEILIKSV